MPKQLPKRNLQDFLRQLTGKQEKSPRWKDCSGSASGRLSYASGALYVRNYFDKADKETALAMIDDLHAVFREMVLASDWMQDETRKIAIDKVGKIGGPRIHALNLRYTR